MKLYKILPLAILLSGMWSCGNNKTPKLINDYTYCLDENFKKNLEFVVASSAPISEGVHLTGTIESNPERIITFKSLFSGIVSSTHFSLGDKVKKGQLLAEISSAEYNSLNAELRSVESQIKVAETKLKSVKSMYSDGIASQRDLNETQSELDILNAEKAKITSNRNLYSTSSERDVFQIKAPAAGYITSKSIAPGTQITVDDPEPLFTISNLDDVWVMANVYASNLQNVSEGMEVEIRTISYPDEVFSGKISVIPQVLDGQSKVLKARIVLENTEMKLKPGMLADITALKRQSTQAVSIPASELIFSDNEHYVVVYKSDCELEVRKIKISAKNHDTVFISEGLAENEKVISRNQLLIFNRLHQ